MGMTLKLWEEERSNISSNIKKGKKGEDLACHWLRWKGYRILERRYRWNGGEVDIIALYGDCLVFCEVRMRKSSYPVRPEETVDRAKRLRLARTASHYLQYLGSKGIQPGSCRFDVISLILSPQGTKLNHIIDAFTVSELCRDAPGAV